MNKIELFIGTAFAGLVGYFIYMAATTPMKDDNPLKARCVETQTTYVTTMPNIGLLALGGAYTALALQEQTEAVDSCTKWVIPK